MHKDIRDLFDQLDRLGVKVTHLWPSCGEPRSVFGGPPAIAVEFDARTIHRLTEALAASAPPPEEEVKQPVAELEAKLAKATAEVDALRVQRDQMQQKVHVAEASLATLLRGLEALGRR